MRKRAPLTCTRLGLVNADCADARRLPDAPIVPPRVLADVAVSREHASAMDTSNDDAIATFIAIASHLCTHPSHLLRPDAIAGVIAITATAAVWINYLAVAIETWAASSAVACSDHTPLSLTCTKARSKCNRAPLRHDIIGTTLSG